MREPLPDWLGCLLPQYCLVLSESLHGPESKQEGKRGVRCTIQHHGRSVVALDYQTCPGSMWKKCYWFAAGTRLQSPGHGGRSGGGVDVPFRVRLIYEYFVH